MAHKPHPIAVQPYQSVDQRLNILFNVLSRSKGNIAIDDNKYVFYQCYSTQELCFYPVAAMN